MSQYRQGDVLIRRIDEIPQDAQPVQRVGGRVILAAGEVTGHHHAIVEPGAELFAPVADRPGLFYLRLDAEATVVHEEHLGITLPPGRYTVEIQREYSPEAPRRVLD